MEDRVAACVALAARIHAGQVDKGGHPYILHPLTVMQNVNWRRLRYREDREDVLCTAVLHDVLEDAPHHGYAVDETAQEAYVTGGMRVAQAVEALTRMKGEPYLREYIPRV